MLFHIEYVYFVKPRNSSDLRPNGNNWVTKGLIKLKTNSRYIEKLNCANFRSFFFTNVLNLKIGHVHKIILTSWPILHWNWIE